MNAIIVMKDAEKSSNDFVKLNNLDNLKGLKTATINDGRENFFLLRDLVHNKISLNIGELFQTVQVFGCTLDKVTLNKKSYTVILSYYFSREGKIKWLLNDLYPMRCDDGSGEATAE